jgi:hypothetical protein
MWRWKSDSLVVLGARESRAQGEAARQSAAGSGKHHLHPRRQDDGVNATELDSPKGAVGSEGPVHFVGPFAHTGIPQGDLGDDEPAWRERD